MQSGRPLEHQQPAPPSFLSRLRFSSTPPSQPPRRYNKKIYATYFDNTILRELLAKLPKTSGILLIRFSQVKSTMFIAQQRRSCDLSFLSHGLRASIESFHSSFENSGISSPVTQAAPVVILSSSARNCKTFSSYSASPDIVSPGCFPSPSFDNCLPSHQKTTFCF